jgi:hypothetical protein
MEPFVEPRRRHQSLLQRILANVFDFFFSLCFAPHDVIEAFLRPDLAMPSRGLIDPMSCAAFDAFQDRGESERPDQPKDRVCMIGHYHRRIEIDGVFV